MKREEIEREGEKSEVLKWANQREYRWVGTADQDPHLTTPHLTPSPPHPNSTRAVFPAPLHHQTHTADDYTEEPQKETVADAQLPLTANPLPPGGSKPRDGQKGKEVVKRHMVCAWGTWLVWLPAEEPLKLSRLGNVKWVVHGLRDASD